VGRGILPTPVIGMVGIIEDIRRVIQHGFKSSDSLIALLGTTRDDLSISEYAATVVGRTTEEMIGEGLVPELHLNLERTVQEACLEAAGAGILYSAHDCSDGGLAAALAESCFSSLNRGAIGARVDLAGGLESQVALFSESPSRIIISFNPAARAQIEEIASRTGCPFKVLGRTGGDRLSIKVGGKGVVDIPIDELERAWRTSLATKIRPEVMVAGLE